jgi:site-specific recombinase XerD
MIERHLRKHAKPLHGLRLAEIDRRTIAGVLAGVERAAGPIARNRARASLSAFFAWLIREGLLDVNPVAAPARLMKAQAGIVYSAPLSWLRYGALRQGPLATSAEL